MLLGFTAGCLRTRHFNMMLDARVYLDVCREPSGDSLSADDHVQARDQDGVDHRKAGFGQQDDVVLKPEQLQQASATEYKWQYPLMYKINWYPVLLLLFYFGASVAYIIYRISSVRELGPYTW
jgi:hypothetical protein